MQNKATVLYVDDNPKSSHVLSSILEECGFRVIVKNDPAEVMELCSGISLCKKEYFDLALLDYEMPKMSGAKLADELKAIMPETPVILLSGRTELPSRELRSVDAHFGHGTMLDDLVWTMRILVQHPSVVVAGHAHDTATFSPTLAHPHVLDNNRKHASGNRRESMRWADST